MGPDDGDILAHDPTIVSHVPIDVGDAAHTQAGEEPRSIVCIVVVVIVVVVPRGDAAGKQSRLLVHVRRVNTSVDISGERDEVRLERPPCAVARPAHFRRSRRESRPTTTHPLPLCRRRHRRHLCPRLQSD